jgi:hypothetical protein
MTIEGGCHCGLCTLNKAVRDRDWSSVERGIDWLIEQGTDSQMRLSYLVHANRRFCGRLDAPSYMREALRIAEDKPMSYGTKSKENG